MIDLSTEILAPTILETGLIGPEPEPEPVEEFPDTPMGAFLRKYRYDPVRFCREVLGAEPFAWQQDAMNRISGPNPVRRLSVRSGHGVGKTACVSMLCVHKLVTSYPVKIIVTAPSASTLGSGLLPEIKSWLKRCPVYIQNLFEVRSDKIMLKKDPDAAFIEARTASADRPESLAGIHSANVLIVCDEASGIPEVVYEAAAGSMSTEGSQTILIGNPTRLTGLFYRSHHELKDLVWDTMHVSCLSVPEIVSDEFVTEMRESHGPESNEFRIRVEGQFAATDDTSLIAADLVEDAMNRDIAVSPYDGIVYGVDPARFGGDRQVICKRRGNVILGFKVFRGLNLMELTGAIVNEAKQDNPEEIIVDVIGVGAGVADRLRELGLNVRDCNVAESSAMNPSAERLRDELWLSVRDWLRQRACKLPEDKTLREELCAPTYTYTSTGKLKVESKDGMRKRLRRSPDLADALCLTFAGAAAGVGGRAPKWIPGAPLRRGIKGI